MSDIWDAIVGNWLVEIAVAGIGALGLVGAAWVASRNSRRRKRP